MKKHFHCRIVPLIEMIQICVIYRQVEASSISNWKKRMNFYAKIRTENHSRSKKPYYIIKFGTLVEYSLRST